MNNLDFIEDEEEIEVPLNSRVVVEATTVKVTGNILQSNNNQVSQEKKPVKNVGWKTVQSQMYLQDLVKSAMTVDQIKEVQKRKFNEVDSINISHDTPKEILDFLTKNGRLQPYYTTEPLMKIEGHYYIRKICKKMLSKVHSDLDKMDTKVYELCAAPDYSYEKATNMIVTCCTPKDVDRIVKCAAIKMRSVSSLSDIRRRELLQLSNITEETLWFDTAMNISVMKDLKGGKLPNLTGDHTLLGVDMIYYERWNILKNMNVGQTFRSCHMTWNRMTGEMSEYVGNYRLSKAEHAEERCLMTYATGSGKMPTLEQFFSGELDENQKVQMLYDEGDEYYHDVVPSITPGQTKTVQITKDTKIYTFAITCKDAVTLGENLDYQYWSITRVSNEMGEQQIRPFTLSTRKMIPMEKIMESNIRNRALDYIKATTTEVNLDTIASDIYKKIRDNCKVEIQFIRDICSSVRNEKMVAALKAKEELQLVKEKMTWSQVVRNVEQNAVLLLVAIILMVVLAVPPKWAFSVLVCCVVYVAQRDPGENTTSSMEIPFIQALGVVLITPENIRDKAKPVLSWSHEKVKYWTVVIMLGIGVLYFARISLTYFDFQVAFGITHPLATDE